MIFICAAYAHFRLHASGNSQADEYVRAGHRARPEFRTGACLGWLCHVHLRQRWPDTKTWRRTGTQSDRFMPGGRSQLAGADPDVLTNAATRWPISARIIGAMMELVDASADTQSELCAGLASSAVISDLWRASRDMAIEHVETCLRLSPRARVGASARRSSASRISSPALRGGSSEPAPRDPGLSGLPAFLSLSCRRARSLGTAGEAKEALAAISVRRSTDY